jgi:hypothetical protein
MLETVKVHIKGKGGKPVTSVEDLNIEHTKQSKARMDRVYQQKTPIVEDTVPLM